MLQTVTFPSGQVKYSFENTLACLWQLCGKRDIVLITDAHIAALYPALFGENKSIIIPAGEGSKSMDTLATVTGKLLEYEATRNTLLVGIGGGVVTDVTGFVASIYMRGVSFAFVPTTLLGMVDAAIGGKNGINIDLYKNILGTINQPEFIFFYLPFLNTLPDGEWNNGFAEIIKYACVFDLKLFKELKEHNIAWYKHNDKDLLSLISTCVTWKNKVVAEDEQEAGSRKLLNFGHTAGHAIENLYHLPHGQAISIGMVIAATLSAHIAGFSPINIAQLIEILQQYGLPTAYPIESNKAIALLRMDKKRSGDIINFILLNRIGSASIYPLSFDILEKAMKDFD